MTGVCKFYTCVQSAGPTKMEIEDNKISWPELESSSYRTLQRVAKSMSLPSNVKKVYLIQMILAKKYKSEAELKTIIQKVKFERQQLSQVRKKRNSRKSHLQGSEVSSTSNSHSPPISRTPKRPGHIVVHCNPDFQQAFVKFKSKQSLLHSNPTKTYSSPKPNRSDRVLRSFNIKTTKNPIYDLTESDSCDQTESKPVYNAVRDNKPVFKDVQTEMPPISSAITTENNPTYSSVRSEPRPVFKVSTENRIKAQSEMHLRPVKNIIVKKYRPAILSSNANFTVRNSAINSYGSNQLVQFGKSSSGNQSRSMPVIVNTMSSVPAKRQRMLSGIYPLIPKEPPPKITYEFVESVGFRHKDGKVSKINALIQKSAPKNKTYDTVLQPGHSIEVTVQDLINCNIDAQTKNQPDYAISEANMTNNNMNMTNHNDYSIQHINDVTCGQNVFDDVSSNQRDYTDAFKENNDNDNQYSVYYHKKIRAEQVKSHRSNNRDVPREEERLPKINAVFSKFNDINCSLRQPIYVQVSEESERIQQYPIYAAKTTNTNLLESLYNFRNQFIVNQPLLQIATTTNTHCVYSTPTITTAVAQQAGALVSSEYISSCERDDQLYNTDVLPRITDLLKFAEQDYRRDYQDEELSSCSSLERSVCQNLGANVTIPEMEDALELISQDGDYMERIGMDVRMQCVLCTWAGPRVMLESHIRKEHPNQIIKENKTEWTITFTLGSLVQSQQWICRVLEHDSLYVLSVKYDSADYLMATLSTIETEIDLPKSGSITIYNKVTGEPYSWEGDIQCLSPNMPFENDANGLKLELSRLDLLPNSANLKLFNGELVLKSPTKVVVGQPELEDIHVILFVKICN